MSRKLSILWDIPRETLVEIVNTAESVVDVCKKLGVNPYNGSNKTVYRLLKYYGIPNPKTKGRFKPRLTAGEIFTENSIISRHIVKKYLIRYNLIPYSCRDCNNDGTHNNKPLSLQIEHINAIVNDHRLENLCFLCPNCHSQTSTYSGKKNKGKRKLGT